MNWTLLANSFLVAGASTLLALMAGLAVAAAITASTGWRRQILIALTISVLALPAFLVTNCWIDLLGANGRLHSLLPVNIFSLAGVVLVLGLLLWPIPALGIFCAWQKLEKEQFEIDAAMRGAHLIRFLLWPAARPALAITAAITFTLALNNFAVPSILQVRTFPAEMWVQFNTHLDASAALRMNWPLLVAPLALLLALRRVDVPWPRESTANTAAVFRRQLGSGWLAACAVACAFTVILSLAVPVAQLVGAPRTWREFAPAFTAGKSAIANSFFYAASASALTIVFGVATARARGPGWLWICFLVPGLLLGIGAVTAFNRPGLEFFSRTAAIVVFVLALRHFALAHSVTRSAYQSLDQHLMDSARLDGARGAGLFLRIIFPQIAPSIAAAAFLVYVLCLWDVETILLVIPPGGETLALRIFNLLHYGHNAHVNALCLLLLLLAVAPLIAFGFWKAVRR
jgi:iron(III) transport system permease protein